jgi:hypothetical protein
LSKSGDATSQTAKHREVALFPRSSRSDFSLSLFFLAVVASSLLAPAQCGTQWQPGYGAPGTNEAVKATCLWDPDGPGPLPHVVVIGGAFTAVGTLPVNHVAIFDPASGSWSALGAGTNGTVLCLHVLPSGDLVAGGTFTTAGGVGASRIARWDGTNWSPLGAGVSGGAIATAVNALTTLPNGDLAAGGTFLNAGGVTANYIARWDGSSWSPIGTGQLPVGALTTLPNGDLVASANAAYGSTNYVKRWNGTSWSNLGAGLAIFNGPVNALMTLPNGDLVAGGSFSNAGGVWVVNIARWDGTSWSPLGAVGSVGPVNALATLPNGDVIAGGHFVNEGHIKRWDGTNWSTLGQGVIDDVHALMTLPNGDLVAGSASSVQRWDGANWSALATAGGGLSGGVRALATMPNGDLVAGGFFFNAGGVSANSIASWNGTNWSALGTGMAGDASFQGVYCLTAMPNGDLVAGGAFSEAGGVSAHHIARWNGTSWSALGFGMYGQCVYCLMTLPNGDLVVGGWFTSAGGVPAANIARWNGTSWSAFGAGTSGPVHALATLPNGDLVAGGIFGWAGGVGANCIARWNGSSWSALGNSGLNCAVHAMTKLPNGDLVVGGDVLSAPYNGVARWNGTSWSALGTGMSWSVWALTTLPNGDLVAAGEFTAAGGVGANRIARWNGTSWSPFGSGVDQTINAVTMHKGDLVAGGAFNFAGPFVSARLARLQSTCPASALPYGAGCTGSGGPNVLTATTLPWTGSTFRATATGMPALALVLSVYGFTPVSIPFMSVLPQGLPGCDIHMVPDFIDVLLPAAGVVHTQLAVPDAVALAGLVVNHYVVPFEVDAALQVLAITSTNALTLTIGSF